MADGVIQITKSGTVSAGGGGTASFNLYLGDTTKTYGRTNAAYFIEWNTLWWTTVSGNYCQRWAYHVMVHNGLIYETRGPQLIGPTLTSGDPIFTVTATVGNSYITPAISLSQAYNWRIFANLYICEGKINF